MFNGDVPEGQGSVNELLAECFEINYDLRVAAETADDDEEDVDAAEDTREAEEAEPRGDGETDALVEALEDAKLAAKAETQASA